MNPNLYISGNLKLVSFLFSLMVMATGSLARNEFNNGHLTTIPANLESGVSPLSGEYTPTGFSTSCDNITYGGTIGFGPDCLGSVVLCDEPAPTIINCSSPDGGSGSMQIIWLKSVNNPDCLPPDSVPNGPDWTIIPGENGLTLDPGIVDEHTCFLRCARRDDCSEFIESNIISVDVDQGCDPVDPDCDDISFNCGNNAITVAGLGGAPYTEMSIYTSDWAQQIFSCAGDCNDAETIGSLPAGDYIIHVKFFNANWEVICDIYETITVNGSGDPCDDEGGDSDGDGICDNQDCAPFDAGLPAAPGSICDDNDPGTTDDMILGDGCTCAGTPVGNSPDCSDITIDAGSSSVVVGGLDGAPVTSLHIFDSNWETFYHCFENCDATVSVNLPPGTFHIVVRYHESGYGLICEIQETVNISSSGNPCDNAGGDSDGDGICDDQDCAPLNADLPADPGSTCDDGNPDTSNDQIQSDGCTCAGTPVSGSPDCNNIIITSGPGFISVSGLDGAPVSSVHIFNGNWETEFQCFQDCGPSTTVNVGTGTYYVFAKYFDTAYGLICEVEQTITVGLGDPCTNAGGDSDGDGVCDNQDCAPMDPGLPAAPGSPCNDGNPYTDNDVVQSDGCSCIGTPVNSNPDCEDITISTGNGAVTIGGLDGAPVSYVNIFDGNYETVFQCFADCDATITVNLPPGDYLVIVRYYDVGYFQICEVSETVMIASAVLADNQLNFEAAKHEEHVELLWLHNRGTLVNEYVIERSTDGQNYEMVTGFDSRGGTASELYQGYDLRPVTGDNYYRVRLEMADGSVSYSDVRTIHYADLADFSLFPNPANDFVKINLEAIVGIKDVKFTVYNNLGTAMKQLELEEVTGKYHQLDVRDLREGLYFVWLDIPGRRPLTKTLVIGKLH